MFKCPHCKEDLGFIWYEEFGSIAVETSAEDGSRSYLCPYCETPIEYKDLPENLK